MNIIDIFLMMTVVIPGIIVGLKKGFIGQLVAVIALTIGIWMSFRFAASLGQELSKHVELEARVLEIIAFIVIFIGVFFALEGFGKLLRKISASILGGWIDRVLGVALAVLKYSLIAGLVVMLFDTINGNFHLIKQESLDKSVFYSYAEWLIHNIFPYLKTFFNGQDIID